MASIRAAQKLWTAVTVAANDDSTPAYVGPATAVVLLCKLNSGTSVDLKVQVAAPDTLSAGRNAMPSADTDWYDLQKRDGSGDLQLVQLTSANPSVAIDLSPLGAPYVRLSVTAQVGSANITAIASAIGQ